MENIISLKSLVSASTTMSKNQRGQKSGSTDKIQPVTIPVHAINEDEVAILNGVHRAVALLRLGTVLKGYCKETGKTYLITEDEAQRKLIYTEIK